MIQSISLFDILILISAFIFTILIFFYEFEVALGLGGQIGRKVKIFELGIFFLVCLNLYLISLPHINQLLHIKSADENFIFFLNLLITFIVFAISFILITHSKRGLQLFGGGVNIGLTYAIYASLFLFLGILLFFIQWFFVSNLPSPPIVIIILTIARILGLETGLFLAVQSFKRMYLLLQ